MAIAQSSPKVSGATRWYAETIRRRLSASNWLSVWATYAQAMPSTCGYPARVASTSFGLAIVGVRQVVADLADLLLDDMEVVDEPLRRWCRQRFLAGGPRERPVCLEQDPAVVRETRQHRAADPGILGDSLSSREGLGVLLEPLDAEQLRDDGLPAAPGGSGSLRSVAALLPLRGVRRSGTRGSGVEPDGDAEHAMRRTGHR